MPDIPNVTQIRTRVDHSDIGVRISSLMHQRGISSVALASGVGVSKQSVCDWLKGRSTHIKPSNLIAIADFFCVSIRWMVTGEDDITDILAGLTSEQRTTAVKILEAYATSVTTSR